MDPNQWQQGDGSHSQHGIPFAYQGQWNPFAYAVPPWVPMQHPQVPPPLQPTPNQLHHTPNVEEPADVDGEEEVEEVSPGNFASAGRKEREGSRTKLGNFAPEEDVNLVRSWLEISCDPIVSTGQKRETFWQRVLNQYNGRRGTYPERGLRSIQNRWDKIKLQVGKFAGYFAEALRDNASGTSDADKTTQAAATFAAVEGHSFQFMHCWELMKDEPKWQEMKHKGKSGTTDFTGCDPDGVEGDEPRTPGSGKRPIGRDAEKSRKKSCPSASTGSTEYASKLQDLSLQKMTMWQEENSRKVNRFEQQQRIEEKRFEDLRDHNKSMLQLEQEKLKIMRDKLDMQMRREEADRLEREKARLERERLEDERILNIDLNACTPELKMYYQALREEILEKIAARRQRNRHD